MTRPSISRVVHYVSYGTPNGEYDSVCRAAIVTEVGEPDEFERVGLFVANPEGLFLKTLAAGGVQHIEPVAGHHLFGGSWHWPEQIEEAA